MMKTTIIISAFPACGKSYCFNHFNGQPFAMLDSDSSKYSWIYDEEGNKTSERNPNFIDDYIAHIKSNIGKVDVIFVSSHKAVRDALTANGLRYFLVYPDINIKADVLQRMKDRGNDEAFIKFQDEHYREFIKEMKATPIGEAFQIALRSDEFIDVPMLYFLLDNSMGNESSRWWNNAPDYFFGDADRIYDDTKAGKPTVCSKCRTTLITNGKKDPDIFNLFKANYCPFCGSRFTKGTIVDSGSIWHGYRVRASRIDL